MNSDQDNSTFDDSNTILFIIRSDGIYSNNNNNNNNKDGIYSNNNNNNNNKDCIYIEKSESKTQKNIILLTTEAEYKSLTECASLTMESQCLRISATIVGLKHRFGKIFRTSSPIIWAIGINLKKANKPIK
ncbi:hypothetical protein H8356DRAFT_1361589 [Neocallimastix lanati (nom. inval.)]|nr:hypothetical protein H8356DRAFT_1361589 [Neocallimastix sp. JGI-2020a]